MIVVILFLFVVVGIEFSLLIKIGVIHLQSNLNSIHLFFQFDSGSFLLIIFLNIGDVIEIGLFIFKAN